MTRWTRHLNDWPTWIKEKCVQHLFQTYGSLGNTWAFFTFSLPLLIISPSLWLNTQVSSPVSKLEITRLLQHLYVFKSSRAHLRRCVFCSSVSNWGTHLVQTFLRSKRFFRIVCTLPSDMPVQLAISLTDKHASCLITIFTATMLALVTEVLGLPGRVSSSTENFPALKALTHLKNCAHSNGLRSIYTTQFILYLLWIYIKPNAAFNIATNFSLLVHVPIKQVNWSVYMTASISIWNNSVSWKAICMK